MFTPAVTDLLGRQYRTIADHQLRPLVPDPLERLDLRRGLDLDRITTRVLGQAVHEPGPGRGLVVRVLDAGVDAVLWGKTAATWWGFGRFRLTPVHVARPRGSGRAPANAQLHNIGSLAPCDLTTHQGIPIARPELVALWLAGMWTHRLPACPELVVAKVGKLLEHAWREGLIDGRYLHALVERSGGRGRSGIVAMRSALESKPPDHVPTGSGTEERFEEILPWTVRKTLQRQTVLTDATVIGVADFVCDRWPLVIEINGEQWHTTEEDRAADRRRYRRMLDLRYSVLVLWQYDIWHDAEVVRDVVGHLVRNRDPRPTLHRPTPAPWEL